MIMVWITLSFLHRGYSLVPVKTVQLGEAATLTCALPIKEFGSTTVHWYKQSPGDGLKLIVTLSKSAPPEYSPEFSRKRFNVENANNVCNLTILKTVQEDEGIYHCGIAEWLYPIQWSETYLSVKGNTQMRSNYTVVQWPTVLDPLQPGESLTLQCSIISVFGKATCPEDLSVFWFRAGSNKSHPNVIYTDGNTHDECEKRSETQKRCVYRFSKNISSSDAGTYYCAVDTCGEILFGNGTKLDIHGDCTWSQGARTVILLLCAVLTICLIVIAVLICMSKKNSRDNCEGAVPQKRFSAQKNQQNKDTWLFSAAVFTMMKANRGALKGAKAVKMQKINMTCKTLGLDH
ncbi:immunoglobulin superfamily member 3-like [Oreochromis niloticus]|uniref:immunoglobulin superfamily member 3-like n=1 Tax=Oreochromis niloticus TaxID=8128 RepID=UPI000673DDE8|nr:immunoglobulin superfamily member 3-like [Oreochromis niloticus]